jgi:hypothetical protein
LKQTRKRWKYLEVRRKGRIFAPIRNLITNISSLIKESTRKGRLGKIKTNKEIYYYYEQE